MPDSSTATDSGMAQDTSHATSVDTSVDTSAGTAATSTTTAATAATAATAPGETADRPLTFHPLHFQAEDGEVNVGRMDEGTFVVLPEDGAALLRRLVEGMTCAQAAAWYHTAYGEPVDVEDFVADLRELGFLAEDGTRPAEPTGPVRWMRLGQALFSPVTAVLYGGLVAAAAVAMVRAPALLPTPHHVFFTHYMSVLTLTIFLGQLPFILLHESAHALAGRRLGVPSRLSIGRRLYYLVLVTTMDGLVGVPRRRRYLPMLAGMLTDVGALAALTLLAAATRDAGGGFPLVGAVALALAYATLMRLAWQGYFFIQTDVYYLVVTVMGCVDLQTTAKQMLANRWSALWRRPPRHDPEDWHPRDRAVARWYSLLIVAGYGFCLVTTVFALAPVVVRVFGTALGRLFGHGGQGGAGLADSALFLALSLGEMAVAGTLYLRERRAAGRRPLREPSLPTA